MTRPSVIERIFVDTGSYWIEVNVSNQLKEVSISVQKNGLVAALKQVADSFFAVVDVAGVTKAEILDDFCQWDFADLDGKVDVVGHQAEGVEAMPKTVHSFPEQMIEAGTISNAEKNILPTVATENDVIDCTGIMNTRFASHITG